MLSTPYRLVRGAYAAQAFGALAAALAFVAGCDALLIHADVPPVLLAALARVPALLRTPLAVAGPLALLAAAQALFRSAEASDRRLLGWIALVIQFATLAVFLSLPVWAALRFHPAAFRAACAAVGFSVLGTAGLAALSPWDLRLLGPWLMTLLLVTALGGVALLFWPASGAWHLWALGGLVVSELLLTTDLQRLADTLDHPVAVGLTLALDLLTVFVFALASARSRA